MRSLPADLSSTAQALSSGDAGSGGESPRTRLAKNLVVARIAAGITQQALAQAADVSRATVAQIEAGVADPRLSTLAALAAALHVPAPLLLFGHLEVKGLAALSDAAESSALASEDMADLHRLVRSGMLRDRAEAGRIAADALRNAGHGADVVTVAAMLSAIAPDSGTSAGVRFATAVDAAGKRAG